MSKNNSRVSSVSYEAISAQAAELEIEPGVYLNATGTAEKAPYLLRVIPAGYVDADGFYTAVAEKTSHAFEETRREDGIRMEVLAQALREGYTHVDTGYLVFELRIAGSVTSTTQALTREANPVYVAVYPSRELAESLAGITAKLSKGAAEFSIETVFGEDSHDRFVTGGEVFQVNTLGLDATEKPVVALAFADGTRQAAEVESWRASYIRATAPAGIDAKTVTIEVTSKGVTLPKPNVPFKYAGEPQPVGPKPRVTGVKDSSPMEPGPGTVIMNYDLIFSGENLGDVTKVHFDYQKGTGGMGAHDVTGDLITASEDKLTLNEAFWTAMSDIQRETEVKATLTTDDGRSCDYTFYAT